MDYGCNRDNCKKGIHCKFAEIVFKLFNPSMHEYDYISCDYLNLTLADEHVGDVTIPTQVIEYSQCSPGGLASQIAIFK
jgi:hypothetical protein